MSSVSLRPFHEYTAAGLLASCLLFGGGQGTLADTACQLLALVVLGFSLLRHKTEAGARLPAVAWVVAIVIAVPLLQLFPVPEGIWSSTPGRQVLEEGMRMGGMDDPVTRLTLTPLATERSFFWTLPALALFLSAMQLGPRVRNLLIAIIVGGASISVLLGLAQLAGGPHSPLRWYDVTNASEAVGFFANRNHFASLLVVALPLVMVGTLQWHGTAMEGGMARRNVGLLAGLGLIVLLILGVAIARSRAGMALAVAAIIGSAVLAVMSGARTGAPRWILAAFAIGIAVSVQFALFGILERLRKDPLEDARFQFLPQVMALASDHQPLGTGLGGFRRAFEAADPAPGASYVNHAHNDWAELWLETSWLGLIASALILLLVVVIARRRPPRTLDQFAKAGLLSLVLLFGHSFVDYPLRTTALLAVLGVLAGLALGSRRGPCPASPKPLT